MLAQERLEVVVVLCQDFGQWLGLDELDHALARCRREHLVRRELQVQLLLLEEAVHQLDDVEHQLVLPDVVALLEDDLRESSAQA